MLPGRNLYLCNHIRSSEDGKMSTTLQNKEQTIDICNDMDRPQNNDPLKKGTEERKHSI